MAEAKPEEGWIEHVAVTGKPQKEPLPNSTFADRAKVRQKAAKKADVETEHVPASAARSRKK